MSILIEQWKKNNQFQLPAEENVIARNHAITGRYAQLYQREPRLYKWAGMAAFASFHIGKKLEMLDWERTGITPLSTICEKESRSLEDDFQVIRIVNNTIFDDIGWIHLAFCEMDFSSFEALLSQDEHFKKVLLAFQKLNQAREQITLSGNKEEVQELVWEANSNILWHEQSEVV